MPEGLNNISLPTSLLAELYQNVLVQGSTRPQSPATVPEPIPFLGKNGKNILIVVNKQDVAYLPDGELFFLTTVLSACGLDLCHVAIVNWQQLKEKSPDNLFEQFSPGRVLLLDVMPGELDLPAAKKYAIQTHTDFDFVVAPSLPVIENSKDEKKGLWGALKQLFSI